MKFVGDMRSLRWNLKETRDRLIYNWQMRKQCRYEISSHLQMEATYGRDVWEEFPDAPDEEDRWRCIRMDPAPQPTELGIEVYSWVSWLWSFVTVSVGWIPCWALGHDEVDDSYGGPDSGYMGFHCKRCGGSWGSKLY